MSDTPKTDTFCKDQIRRGVVGGLSIIPADFARNLERENTKQKAYIQELESMLNRIDIMKARHAVKFEAGGEG